MKVGTFTVGAFQENCYLLIDETAGPAGSAVLVDPGAEGERLVAAVRASGATLEAIWLTHAHVDHVGGIAAVRRVWDVPIFLHPLDRAWYDRAAAQAAFYGLPFDEPPAPDVELVDGAVVRVGGLEFQVMHAPGHAPGLVVFHRPGVAFAGDLLFAGSIGRTDLPLCSPRDMAASLERIAALPEDTVVYPGHGPATSIGEELRSNPFLTGRARVVGA